MVETMPESKVFYVVIVFISLMGRSLETKMVLHGVWGLIWVQGTFGTS